MKDSLHHALLFRENGHYPAAVEEAFLDVCQVALLLEFGQYPFKYPPQLCPLPVERHADLSQVGRGIVHHLPGFIQHFVDHRDDLFS